MMEVIVFWGQFYVAKGVLHAPSVYDIYDIPKYVAESLDECFKGISS
jgi:hypothetical protein